MWNLCLSNFKNKNFKNKNWAYTRLMYAPHDTILTSLKGALRSNFWILTLNTWKIIDYRYQRFCPVFSSFDVDTSSFNGKIFHLTEKIRLWRHSNNKFALVTLNDLCQIVDLRVGYRLLLGFCSDFDEVSCFLNVKIHLSVWICYF